MSRIFFSFALLLFFPLAWYTQAQPTTRPATKPTIRPTTQPSQWPTFPTTSKAVQRLLAHYPAPPFVEETHNTPNAFAISEQLFKQPKKPLFTGWRPIFQQLQSAFSRKHTSVLLWGTAHDSSLQFARFTRLLGGTGLSGPREAIIEMLYADGRWQGIPRSRQTGDNDVLAAIAQTGSPTALRTLAKRQRTLNHVVWKYGYLDEIINFTLFARGRGLRVGGCELPPALSRSIRVPWTQRLRIRELHCALANRLTRDTRRQIAMFWGRGHIGPDGIRRFLPHQARVTSVYVYGGGKRMAGLEIGLKDEVKLLDPLLIPLKTITFRAPGSTRPLPWLRRYVLILPGALASQYWRKRRLSAKPNATHNLVVEAGLPPLRIGSHHIKPPAKLTLPPGHYVMRAALPSQHTLFAHLHVTKHGVIRLHKRQKQVFIDFHQ
jgi:hypothetical protein